MNENEKSESGAEVRKGVRILVVELNYVLKEVGVHPDKITPEGLAVLIEALGNR